MRSVFRAASPRSPCHVREPDLELSSLDNLGSQVLDKEARRYLERAREGLDRQAAIVRAMSEATRLEAAFWDMGLAG